MSQPEMSQPEMSQPGKIYVASMNMRGKWAEPLDPKAIKINVTSAQGKTSKNRLDFSPMTEVAGTYKGFWNFESYWQSGKVFEGVPRETTQRWWRNVKEAKRRYPNSKGKRVLHAVWEHTGELDYVESRKQVYVPEYTELIKDREMTKHWAEMLKRGHSLVIYDFDGPRTEDGEPICLELTDELLQEKLHYTRYPFGHGYIVAATIAGKTIV